MRLHRPLLRTALLLLTALLAAVPAQVCSPDPVPCTGCRAAEFENYASLFPLTGTRMQTLMSERSGLITQVWVLIDTNYPAETITLRLHGENPAHPTDRVLAERTFQMTIGAAGYDRLVLDPPLPVTAGQRLAISVSSAQGAGAYRLVGRSSDRYPEGQQFVWDSSTSTWLPQAGDFSFTVWLSEEQYQTNTPEASLRVGGIESDGTRPAVREACADEQLDLEINSTLPGNPYEILLSSAPAIGISPCTSPGAALAGPSVVNLDLTSPVTYMWGGAQPSYQPMFNFNGGFVAGSLGSPTTVTAQMLVFDATAPGFIRLSQAAQLNVVPGTGAPVRLSMSDDSFRTVAIPACWSGGSVSFYGTSYTELNVLSNGRVMFGGGNLAFEATAARAASQSPSVGFWTDLTPNSASLIEVRGEAGDRIALSFTNVPYFRETATADFSMVFDRTDGSISLDLSAVAPNPLTGVSTPQTGDAQWLGVSPGLGATIPNATVFSSGISQTPATATDMLFDFWDGAPATAPNGIGLLQSIQNIQASGGQLVFTPTMVQGQDSYTATVR